MKILISYPMKPNTILLDIPVKITFIKYHNDFAYFWVTNKHNQPLTVQIKSDTYTERRTIQPLSCYKMKTHINDFNMEVEIS